MTTFPGSSRTPRREVVLLDPNSFANLSNGVIVMYEEILQLRMRLERESARPPVGDYLSPEMPAPPSGVLA